MKLKKILVICLLVSSLLIFKNVNAELVNHGDYSPASPGILDGDLVIIAGNLSVNHSFTVNGDVKITSGKVLVETDFVTTKTVDLHVRGDLIVTNTESSGNQDASINVPTGRLIVTGEVMTRSAQGKAFVNGRYGIEAGRIVTAGNLDSYITSTGGSVDVAGEIVTDGNTNARIDVLENLSATSISTNGKGSTPAYITVGALLDVGGLIRTRSETSTAYILSGTAQAGGTNAGAISTYGYSDAHVKVGSYSGNIDVGHDLIVTSSLGDAYVEVESGSLTAGGIATKIYGGSAKNAYVKSNSSISVNGDIHTQNASTGGDGYVQATVSSISALSITTSADADAYIGSGTSLDVKGAIVTYSFGDSGNGFVRSTTSGGVKAGSIKTKGAASAFVAGGSISGGITVKENISTESGSATGDSSVNAIGDISAENIFTNMNNGNGPGYVRSTSGSITVEDVIKTKNLVLSAYVEADDELVARSIVTEGATDAYVKSITQYINVKEDIFTTSTGGDAYVWATSGNITAQKIKTSAPSGYDGSIRAAAGSGDFMVSFSTTATITIKDAEFHLDKDLELNTVLTLLGTCTINGKGHQINFDDDGRIIVGASATLFLTNIDVNKFGNEAISCADGTGTIYLQDASWSLSSDSYWKNGSLIVSGNFDLNGAGNNFYYQSAQASTIQASSIFRIGSATNFRYDASSNNRIAMTDSTSWLNFDNSDLYADENIRFTNGTLVIDNKVLFSPASGKTVDFGTATVAERVGGRITLGGDGSFI
jgi:hypothetical protein